MSDASEAEMPIVLIGASIALASETLKLINAWNSEQEKIEIDLEKAHKAIMAVMDAVAELAAQQK